jgi:alkaline phosphatase D
MRAIPRPICIRLVASAALLAVWACATPARSAEATITHGPILGRLSDDGVGVWARTSRPGKFLVHYGASQDSLTEVSPVVDTSLDHDNTGWVHIRGLAGDTRYFYRLETADGGKGPGGSFRTLPRTAEYVDPKLNPKGLFNFRFEFACGNNQTVGQGAGPEVPAFKTMLDRLKDKIHFSILNGDWLYEDRREYSVEEWRAKAGIQAGDMPPTVRVAPTIVGTWENYKVYLERGRNLAEYHRHVPSFFTFDDHEILNDVWGAGSPGLRDRRAVFRDIGVRAWYDYIGWSNPVAYSQDIRFGRAKLRGGSDILEDSRADFASLDKNQAATLHIHWGGPTAGVNDNALDGVGGDPNAGVYEIVAVLDKNRLRIRPAPPQDGEASYSIGRLSHYKMRVGNCEFYCLDTRTHRQMHDVKQPDKPGISMLGLQQRKWLLDGLAASDADFLFVVSSVNFMVPHVGGGAIRTTNKDDAWTVFLDERETLINAFDKLGKPVFVLTGDLHNSFAIKITDRVWEFASGPHNSNNHWYTDEGDRPASGPFQYGPRKCDIRWSTHYLNDIPREELQHPTYCVVQVNNVYNNPPKLGETRWVAYPRPQVVFQYYDGRTGDLSYAEAIPASR